MSDGKWIPDLSPEMPVVDAARTVLAARFGVVRHYLPLAAESPFDNPEYVHQLRVGTRRAGAALRVFADCLPKKPERAAKKSLRAIRRAAGGARDWDVFLDNLAAVKALTTTAGRPALDFLRGYALGERSAAQEPLVCVAADTGPDFETDSAALVDVVRAPDDADQTFGDLAFAQLGELLAAFDQVVSDNPIDPAALHQLRILGKRVRYAMELFAACFAPPLKDVLYPAVEKVQEILGGVQDAAVGVERVTGVRDRVKAALPGEWGRFQKGITGLITSQRAKVPAGKKAFAGWRAKWSALFAAHPLESLRVKPTA